MLILTFLKLVKKPDSQQSNKKFYCYRNMSHVHYRIIPYVTITPEFLMTLL